MTLVMPQDISARLARQWQRADKRIALFSSETTWPERINLREPSLTDIRQKTNEVRDYFSAWRQSNIGEVVWKNRHYRGFDESISIPDCLLIHSADAWIEATRVTDVREEFKKLQEIMNSVSTPGELRDFLLRRRSLIRDIPTDDCITSMEVARMLTPGCAGGAPIRSLSIQGIDTKFIERHRAFISAVLELRYGNQLQQSGLEEFLGCAKSNDHWLLVVDLDGGLLPMKQLRVSDNELATRALPGKHVLIIENEQCAYQLPEAEDTIAVLGAGLNLRWLTADWLDSKSVAYWGDIDTWGLQMLASARERIPSLTPLMMNQRTFETFADTLAVSEPHNAGNIPPTNLTRDESILYQTLIAAKEGRLEQERLPTSEVHEEIRMWATRTKHLLPHT